MFITAVPLLRVQSSRVAMDFYCSRLGFSVGSTYRQDAGKEDPAYHVMVRDDAILHVSSFPGDGVAGNVVTIAVIDIQALHDELVHAGVDTGAGIMDQAWGDREVYVLDPAGNTLRFQESS